MGLFIVRLFRLNSFESLLKISGLDDSRLFPLSRRLSNIHVSLANQFIQIQRLYVRSCVENLCRAVSLVERNHLGAVPQIIVWPKQLRVTRKTPEDVTVSHTSLVKSIISIVVVV